MGQIQGKVAVITGASAGIGAATAVELCRLGAKVVLGARRMERLEEVAAKCRSAGGGGEAVAARCDVAKREDVEKLASLAVEKFGRLDVMIANAGYGFLERVDKVTERQFDEIVATNVKGTLYAMQAAARVMLKQPAVGTGKSRRGHIISVSSGAGRRGLPLYGVYAMTKAAQLSLTEALRVELMAEGVYASTVHPLTTATEFFEVASQLSHAPSKGLGKPQTAEAVARKIVGLIRKPKPELWPKFASRWGLIGAVALPSLADRSTAKMMDNRMAE